MEDVGIEALADGIYKVIYEGRQHLATENLAKGISVYGEQLVRVNLQGREIELRSWDHFRSKLAAAILKGLRDTGMKQGSRVLYLGASTGTTVSHVSDIVGQGGLVFAVEVSQRVARELIEKVVKYRKNVVPIVEDARRPDSYGVVYGRIDVVYCDIAQPDQTDIAILNSKRFLAKDGKLLLVVKTRSIDVLKEPERVVKEEEEKLERNGFLIEQILSLEPFDRDHSFISCKVR